MPSTTTLQGLPYPLSSDSPAGNTQILSLANAIEKQSVMVFASSAARTTAFTNASVSATEGMLCWLQDVNRFEYYTGTAWRGLINPSGLPDIQTSTSTLGPTSGTTELTLMSSSSLTLDGSTLVKVVFEWGNSTPSVAGDIWLFRIYEDSTAKREFRFRTITAAGETGGHIEWISPTAPSAGSHTYSAKVLRTGGTGTLTLAANSTVIIQLSVVEFK